MSGEARHDLLASAGGTTPTLLPADPAGEALAGRERAEVIAAAADHPTSSLAWALLAENALGEDGLESNVMGYAYARTGYHRGLDALRRAGWRGSGPIPWEHVPNRGFLRALWALHLAAERIGETGEADRCAQFLRDSSETAYQVLSEE